MLLADQAEALILSLVQALDPEQDSEVIPLAEAMGRILAVPVTSALDFPHWDNSAMDGYAVRHADVQGATSEQPVVLDIIEEIPAGHRPQRGVQAGQAARILTGSVMPVGADTVVMQEVTRREGDRLFVLAPSEHVGHFVRAQATFYRAGERLLSAQTQLGAPEIAVLAAAQCAHIRVYRRPRVAILSTGSELVGVEEPLQVGQIVDSNQYALAALVAQAGAEPICLGRVPDQPDVLHSAIAQALSQADLVLSSGGVSVGDYDYVDSILEALGAVLHIRAVAVRPGKPLTVATWAEPMTHRTVVYFGLPGNPVSALVSFWRFVLPALRKLSGVGQGWGPLVIQGRSLDPLRSDGKRESYIWGRLTVVDGGYQFHRAEGSHSSGNLINLAQTNSLAIVPRGVTHIDAGEPIQIMLTGQPMVGGV